MLDRTMTVTICGRRWRLRFARLRGDKHGWCDPPSKLSKEILINTERRSRRRVMEDLIHEAVHAADWSKAEEWVEEFARDLARMLDRVDKSGIIGEIADEQG